MAYTLIPACREVRAVDKRKCGTFTREYDCCRRQTDMARRYPDDDPLRHLSSHSVALTVGLSVQRHHQHEIPAGDRQSRRGEGRRGLTYRASLRGESGVSVRRRVVHLWSGLGLPFFLMLFAVVSLKWSRPTVTFVTCSGGRVTLRAAESEICDRYVAVKRTPPSRTFGVATAGQNPQASLSLQFFLTSFSKRYSGRLKWKRWWNSECSS